MNPKPKPPEPSVVYGYPPPSIAGFQTTSKRPPPPPKLTPEEIRMVEAAVMKLRDDDSKPRKNG